MFSPTGGYGGQDVNSVYGQTMQGAQNSSDWSPYFDPNYAQAAADLGAQGAADAATLKAQRQRALIQFGEVPNFADAAGLLGANFSADIGGNTADLAKKNTTAGLSTVARINQHNTDLINGIRNNLAARGGLRSGETGYKLGRENTDYTRAQYDARQKLVDYLAGANAAYVAAQRARELQLAQLLAAQQPPPGYTGNGATPLAPLTSNPFANQGGAAQTPQQVLQSSALFRGLTPAQQMARMRGSLHSIPQAFAHGGAA